MEISARAPVHLTAHLRALQAAGQSPKTIEARTAVVRRLSVSLGTNALHVVTTSQLAGWLARPGWKRATRRVYRYHLRAYFGWMLAAGLIEHDPTVGLGRVRVPPGAPKPVNDETLGRILTRAKPPYLGYFTLAAYAGLRCLEIVSLEREDITADELVVRGKGDKVRVVPTHPLVWRLAKPLPDGPVWHLAGGCPPHVDAQKLSSYGRRTLSRLGCKGTSMHQLRHWFGSTAYRKSHNLRAVQELLGHSSVATTQVYTLVSSEERQMVVRALPAVA